MPAKAPTDLVYEREKKDQEKKKDQFENTRR